MVEYLQRDEAPLQDGDWERVDETVVKTAKQHLVGRRFIPVFGPFGVGVQTIHHDVFEGMGDTCVNMTGDCDEEPLGAGERDYRRLPILHKDFQVHWRDIETAQKFGVPFDCSLAAAAAFFVATAEDRLIFHGRPELKIDGLLTAKGRTQLSMNDWTKPGTIFDDVAAASEKLASNSFYGPYALVLSPKLYAMANRVYENTGVLELEQIEKIANAGVFRSALLPDDKAMLVSTGAQNMDLAVAQDLVTAYLDTEKMNHVFRVMEVLTLRIKRPASICTFE